MERPDSRLWDSILDDSEEIVRMIKDAKREHDKNSTLGLGANYTHLFQHINDLNKSLKELEKLSKIAKENKEKQDKTPVAYAKRIAGLLEDDTNYTAWIIKVGEFGDYAIVSIYKPGWFSEKGKKIAQLEITAHDIHMFYDSMLLGPNATSTLMGLAREITKMNPITHNGLFESKNV